MYPIWKTLFIRLVLVGIFVSQVQPLRAQEDAEKELSGRLVVLVASWQKVEPPKVPADWKTSNLTVSAGSKGLELASRFRVQRLPAWIFLSASGKWLKTVYSPEQVRQTAQTLSPEDPEDPESGEEALVILRRPAKKRENTAQTTAGEETPAQMEERFPTLSAPEARTALAAEYFRRTALNPERWENPAVQPLLRHRFFVQHPPISGNEPEARWAELRPEWANRIQALRFQFILENPLSEVTAPKDFPDSTLLWFYALSSGAGPLPHTLWENLKTAHPALVAALTERAGPADYHTFSRKFWDFFAGPENETPARLELWALFLEKTGHKAEASAVRGEIRYLLRKF
jgi:hypothetical protein